MSLGPGNPCHLTAKARMALEKSEVVVGYRTYVGLIDPDLLKGKETISTGMRGEIHRCKIAIEKTLEGRYTALVSSGDAGIYGMAGLVLELLAENELMERVEFEIIPGIPALSAAALLGAPLMHDFAVISLSDLMTPWEEIQARVEATLVAKIFWSICSISSVWLTKQTKYLDRCVLESLVSG
nr:hypothetical protein [Desulfobacterales bacterium]